MHRSRTKAPLTSLAALTGLSSLVLVAGCTGGDEPSTPTTGPSVTASPTSEDTDRTTAPGDEEAGAPDAGATDAPSEDPTGTGPTEPEQPTGTDPTGDDPTGDDPTASPSASGEEPSVEPPTDDLAVPEGSGCTPGEGPLPDGLWYGEVVGADPAGIEFDLACFFLGEEADKAALEDGQAMVPVPNGYYVRNDDPTLRTADVPGTTQVLHYPTGDPAAGQVLDFAGWARLVESGEVLLTGAWLTVDAGAVVGIEEQWTP